jgi:uncharacterized protein YjbI with pentapeptide repeats
MSVHARFQRLTVVISGFLVASGLLAANGLRSSSISAKEFYAALWHTDQLRALTVTEPIDLGNPMFGSRAGRSGQRTIRFKDVILEGITATGAEVVSNLVFENTRIGFIEAQNVEWRGRVIIREAELRGEGMFHSNVFHSSIQVENSNFLGDASFAKSIFRDSSDFLGCTFQGDARFPAAEFDRPAHFNDTVFQSNVQFDSAVFKDDASFLDMTVKDRASFLNVLFRSDAEFRFSQMNVARFGAASLSTRPSLVQAGLTVFNGLADFRNVNIGHAFFDFVDFKQAAALVNSHFGPGGASFRNANLEGPVANFEGVESAGPMVFSGAYLPTIRFHWDEIGSAVLANREREASTGRDIRIPILEHLMRRLDDLGRPDESQRLFYHLSTLRNWDTVQNKRRAPEDKFLAVAEWIFWGLPTDYGTKFGRILAVSLSSWLIFTVPFWLRSGSVVRVPSSRAGRGAAQEELSETWLYEPLRKLPAGAEANRNRVRAALSFCFILMFKTRSAGARYYEAGNRGNGLRCYMFAVWFIGGVYVALLGLTFVNTSPSLSRIIGKLAF